MKPRKNKYTMILKNLLFVFASLLPVLSSCTDEEAVDRLAEGHSTNKLTFLLTTSPTLVKADAPASEVIATPDELKIGSCILAIFEVGNNGMPGAKVCIQPYANLTSDKSADNGSPLYTVSLPASVRLEFAKTYKIVIIANPASNMAATYSACPDYAALQQVVESSLDASGQYAFNPSALMKAGELLVGQSTDVPLSNATTSEQLSVPLTQLAARIDLKIKVDLGKRLVSEKYTEVGGDVLLDEGNIKSGLSFESGLSSSYDVSNLYFKNRHITLDNPTGGSTKCVLLNNKQLIREHTYESWTIRDLLLTVKNIRGKVIAVLPAADYENDSRLTLIDRTFTEQERQDVLLKYVTFYTYQRTEAQSAQRPFEVQLSGDIYRAKIVEKTRVAGNFILLNLKRKDDLTSFLNKVNDPAVLESYLVVYATGAGSGLGVIAENRRQPVVEVPGEDAVVEGSVGTSTIGQYSGSFQIVPATGLPVASGNRYRITATIRNMSMPLGLAWEVAPWDNDYDVTIPPFN